MHVPELQAGAGRQQLRSYRASSTCGLLLCQQMWAAWPPQPPIPFISRISGGSLAAVANMTLCPTPAHLPHLLLGTAMPLN